MDRQRAHTHKRNRLRAIYDCESKKRGNTGFHADVFRFEGLSHTEGWRVLNNETPPSTKKKSPDDGLPPEKRGRKLPISPAMLHDVEELVKEHAEARTWGWEKSSEGVCERTCVGWVGACEARTESTDSNGDSQPASEVEAVC
jgi:hypothetical protein